MIRTILFLAISGFLLLSACKNEKTNTQPTPATTTTTATTATDAPKAGETVFINTDTLMTKYQFYIDAKNELEGRLKSMQSELEKRAKSIQDELAGYQKRAETMSPNEMQSAQASLAEKERKAQEYSAKVQESIGKKQEELDKLFKQKINEYLKKIATENNYDYILSYNSAGIGMLYGNPQKDITQKVLTELNDLYKAEKGKK